MRTIDADALITQERKTIVRHVKRAEMTTAVLRVCFVHTVILLIQWTHGLLFIQPIKLHTGKRYCSCQKNVAVIVA